MKYNVIDLENKKVGDIELDDAIFGTSVKKDILARVIKWQLAKRRAGTHAVKTMATISGTTRKPYKQKGTGNARQGSLRGAQFRHGAPAFGPVVRDHGFSLNKKIRALGLKCALASKVAENKLIVLDDIKLATPKTKDFKAILNKLNLTSAFILAGAEVDKNLSMAAANIPNIDVLVNAGANVYDIMKADTLVLTRDSVAYLEGRLK